MVTLKLEIVTPEEKIYSEDVEMVTLPGSEGEFGVYLNHVPLLTTLVPGELRVVKGGREGAMAIGEGCVESRVDESRGVICRLQRGILRLRLAPLRMTSHDILGIIAGNGVYPRLLADAARKAGVGKIIAAAFTGETDPVLAQHVDLIEWMRVGQLNRLLKFFNQNKVHHAIMAGQIAPKNLFDLRRDLKALMLLGKLKQRNAESIFAAIADELAGVDVELLPATTFLED